MSVNEVYEDVEEDGMEFYIKRHVSPEGTVIAICDRAILGMEFREDRFVFKVSEAFYGGNLATLSQCLEVIRSGSNVNMVGENIVHSAIAAGLIDEDMIIYIDNVPHAQMIHI